MNCFPDELHVKDIGLKSGVRWLELDHGYRVITSKGMFRVPEGFQTDGASIPQAFHSIIGPMSGAFRAGIFHDWAYSRCSNGYFPADRKMADDVFLELMFNSDIGWLERGVIHRAVRLFGGSSYKKR